MSSIFNTSTKRKADSARDRDGAYDSSIQSPPSKRAKGDAVSPSSHGPVAQTMVDLVKTQKGAHKKKTEAALNAAPVDNTAVYFRDQLLWLTRPQKLSEQNVWLLHYRDNLVPGATGPKSGQDVTQEFNKKFKDEMKKELVWKTLQKRISTARKQFYIDNPEYEAAVKYPPGIFEDGDKEAKEEQPEVEDVDETMGIEDEGLGEQTYVSDDIPQILIQPSAPSQKHVDSPLSDTPEPSRFDEPVPTQAKTAPDLLAHLPGAPTIPSIYSTQIFPIDRAHYHLRRRSNSTVAFRLSDKDEEAGLTDRDDVQYVDHAHLLRTSPAYLRFATDHPDSPVLVPEQFSANTVNAFIQIISPVRTTHLPTHYLWNSKKPVAGEYDRFGGVEAEKILWTVDALLQLQAFARQMEALWICDMVIDRLHWMFLEQTKLREFCRSSMNSLSVQGKGTPHLPSVSNLEGYGIAADDFSDEILNALVAEPMDTPTLVFVADLMGALRGAPEEEWLDAQRPVVQTIFERAGADSRLMHTSRGDFCARYHHHQTATASCYTATYSLKIPYLVQQVFSAHTHKDLLNMSTHVSLDTELRSVMHTASGASKSLKELNSSPAMLETEKMILEMEMRLQEAKDAASRAREAGVEEKERETARAKEVAKGMFKGSETVAE